MSDRDNNAGERPIFARRTGARVLLSKQARNHAVPRGLPPAQHVPRDRGLEPARTPVVSTDLSRLRPAVTPGKTSFQRMMTSENRTAQANVQRVSKSAPPGSPTALRGQKRPAADRPIAARATAGYIPARRISMREDNASYQIPGPAGKTYLGPGFTLRQRTEDGDEVDATPERGFAIVGGRVIGKAARKTKEGASAGTQLATKSARPVVVDISSSSDSDGSERGSDNSADALVAAVEALTLHGMEVTRTLPFLPRNVRKGFILRCERKGISMSPAAPPKQAVTVICQREDEDDDAAFRREMTEWLCPLCSFHGSFETRNMLTAHLQWDHSEVHFEWSDRGPKTNLNVMIPDLNSDSSDDTTSTSSVSRSPTPIPLTITSEDIVDVKHQLTHVASPSREMSAGPPPFARSPSPLSLKLKFEVRPVRTEPEEHAVRPPPAATVDPRPGGPAARWPFLPAYTEGGNDVFYSCRPGGPRLYDLIGTLPMEEFGLMGWSVIEREEEIFEMDSMRDEDKVMSALWLRWIMVHRKEFIRNYHKGVESFVKSNLRMIYLAAGRYALRIWLLMLHNHRFLTPHEMALILKVYDGLVEKLEAPQQPANTGT